VRRFSSTVDQGVSQRSASMTYVVVSMPKAGSSAVHHARLIEMHCRT